MTNDLEKAVEKAVAETARCRENLGRVQNGIAAAQAIVNSSEQRRAKFALDAATGDASAAAAMKKIHAEDDVAKKQLADMNTAPAPAHRNLALANQAETNAHRDL